jgi:hypothetical protein
VKPPASRHFNAVSLDPNFNARRDALPSGLEPPAGRLHFDEQVIAGKTFLFGSPATDNVVLLDDAPVEIELGVRASYLLFVHVVRDVPTVYARGFADSAVDGNTVGGEVSRYSLHYDDGAVATTPIVRRFAIQQARIGWGASPVAAVPAAEDRILRPVWEELAAGRPVETPYGLSETRHISSRDRMTHPSAAPEFLWIYALPNPRRDSLIRSVLLSPVSEPSAVYALTLTRLAEHPLRPPVRRRLRFDLPQGVALNAIGELDELGVDLGSVISARAALEYDPAQWAGSEALVTPKVSESSVIVDYVAHPGARLYVETVQGQDAYELTTGNQIKILDSLRRLVRLCVIDAESRAPVAVRLHVHGDDGEYLAPRGHHRKVNAAWFEDSSAEFAAGDQQYAYIDGECRIDLPIGTVHIEITRGYEIAPVRTSVTIGADTETITFELERVLRWRERGWVSADTHVHFLSPHAALLEGAAEDVNVVNLLASQWGETSSNVGDFDGRTTLGAPEFGGTGEFLVRVGSENRMQVLGHVSLLGYQGQLIHPLSTGGPSESALGDPLEATLATWARSCLEQSGLVVMPHAPNPQLERAASIVLGLVDAVELAIFNPLTAEAGLSPYGLADWYRYLNLGYRIPLVAGSDKMSAAMLLGGARTYAQLGEREFTYENWIDAIRGGDTFATIGPLASLRVEGVEPGGSVALPSKGGVVVEWLVESATVPITRVEIIAGGHVVHEAVGDDALRANGTVTVPIMSSTWIALRVRGSYHGREDDVAAHTSAVQVLVAGRSVFSDIDAAAVLDQIQAAIAYVDTLAPVAEVRRLREFRASLEGAYGRLHERMHHAGVFHAHTIHDPAHPHEH